MTSVRSKVAGSLPNSVEKRLQKRGLRVIIGGKRQATSRDRVDIMNTQPKDREFGENSILALKTLEAQLEGEHFFLESVRETIRSTRGIAEDAPLPIKDFKNLIARGGHDNLIHIAQFYFFLDALDCRTPNQLEALIESHNAKVLDTLTPAEKTKSKPPSDRFMAANEITQIRLTLEYYGELVFSLTELGKLLSDLMSTSTTANLLKELVVGGVFEQVGGPALDQENRPGFEYQGPATTNSKRKLIRPKPNFLADYRQSLLMARAKIKAM